MTDDVLQIVRLTPEGRGAVAVLLVEGPTAAERVDRSCFRHGQARLTSRPASRILHGHWGSPDGEDVVVCRISPAHVEIHCHGGRAAIERIAADLSDCQTRTVSWREWLAQHEPSATRAEARSLLAAARTERTAAILLDQYSGALQAAVTSISGALDAGQVDVAKAELQTLLRRAPIGLHLVDPWRVVLAGPPNVGKSSLINALVGYQRSIVFDQPGTTRDVVTAVTAIDGWLFELTDTAGLRESSDLLERAGVERARRQIDEADCIVIVSDATASRGELGAEAREMEISRSHRPLIHVANKCDLLPPEIASPAVNKDGTSRLLTSAVSREGVSELAAAIVGQLVGDGIAPGDAVPFTMMHVDHLRKAMAAIELGDPQSARVALEPLLG
jgi:tRNA modification GTPase